MAISDDNSFGPFYLETSRDKRLKVFAELRRWFMDSGYPADNYPFYAIEPWTEEPEPSWPRHPFTIPMQEIFYNAELKYFSLCLMITSRSALFVKSDNRSNKNNEAIEPVNEEYVRCSKLWSENHPGLRHTLREADIVGLDGHEIDGMKFLSFRTAEIPRDVLGRFLDTAFQPDPRTDIFKAYEPFSYLIADNGPLAIGEFGPGATRSGGLNELTASQVLDTSEEHVRSIWEHIIEPVKNARSMIGTHSFIILDEDTAKPGNETVKIVQPAPEGGYNSSRVSFGALNSGVLKAFEMCFLHVDMLPIDEHGVIREDVYGIKSSSQDAGQ